MTLADRVEYPGIQTYYWIPQVYAKLQMNIGPSIHYNHDEGEAHVSINSVNGAISNKVDHLAWIGC